MGKVLTTKQKETLRKRALSGEDRKALAAEYGISVMSVHCHSRRKPDKKKIVKAPIVYVDKLKSLIEKKVAFEKIKEQIHIGNKLILTEGKESADIVVTIITNNFIAGKNKLGILESFTWSSIFCGDVTVQKIN